MLKHEKQPIRLMLSLEMLGYCDPTPNSQLYPPGLKYFYPSEGNFIALIGNVMTIPDLIGMSRHICQANTPCEWLAAGLRGLIVPATRRSDHAPFWDRGYRAIMVTDTADLRNPNYHSSRDTLETIDLDFLTGVYRGLSIALSLLMHSNPGEL
jgi:Zn-dependent M28 family amino/carboxypeptidase